jgi:hypothetical protein
MILATAIAGPLTVASRGLNTALVAKDQTTAYYLAQDAMEFVRFARDTNKLAGATDWLVGTGGTGTVVNLSTCKGTNGCSIDSQAGTVSTCSSAACSQGNMRYHANNRLYTNVSSNATGLTFNRVIKITPPAGAASITNEAVVTIKVSWTDIAGVTHPPVTIIENIFDWQ